MTIRENREAFIQFLYRYFLLNKTKQEIIKEINENFQVTNLEDKNKKILINMFENIDEFIFIISQKIDKTWQWKRIPNILKSVLIDGYYEIVILKTQKAIVINELMDISHKYSPTTNNSFINAILDTL